MVISGWNCGGATREGAAAARRGARRPRLQSSVAVAQCTGRRHGREGSASAGSLAPSRGGPAIGPMCPVHGPRPIQLRLGPHPPRRAAKGRTVDDRHTHTRFQARRILTGQATCGTAGKSCSLQPIWRSRSRISIQACPFSGTCNVLPSAIRLFQMWMWTWI